MFLRHFVALLVPVLLYGQLGKPAPDNKTKASWSVSRTPDGHPDLQGVWSNASLTPLERPKELGAKEFYTEAELATLKARPGGTRAPDRAPTVEAHYDLSQFGLDGSQFELAKNLRTSIIVGPEGRVPPLLPEPAKRVAARAAFNREHLFDGPENRGLAERCILWGSEGPPMLPVGYNANLQIFQNADHVAIMQEMIHDVRIIPTNNQPHLSGGVRQWFGDSRGHWDGDTLVVDTTNFTDRTAFRGSTEKLHVTERFTRVNANTIIYQFTVEDPAAWAKPWSGEVPMLRTAGPIFEYACHEGNLGMPNILSGARAEEKAKQQ